MFRIIQHKLMTRKQFMNTLKTKSLKTNLCILFLILLVSCQKNENAAFPFQDKEEYVSYNVVKKTEIPPTTGHTFVFRSNGDFYHFEYLIKNSDGEARSAEN